MSRRKTKTTSPNRGGLIVLSLLAIGVVGALAYYVQFTPANRVVSPRKSESSKPATNVGPTAKPKPAEVQVLVPVATFDAGGVSFGQATKMVPGDGDVRLSALNLFLGELGGANRIQALSVDLRDRIATISLTPEFLAGQGSGDESVLVNGIRSVLGQFPEVDRLQFTVEGQVVDSLGHFEFTEPLSVIRPEDWSRPTTPDEEPSPSAPN